MNAILTVALAASVTGLNQDIGSRTGDLGHAGGAPGARSGALQPHAVLQRPRQAARPHRLLSGLAEEPNVHGGVKYLRQLHDRYITGEGLDEQNRTLLAFA